MRVYRRRGYEVTEDQLINTLRENYTYCNGFLLRLDTGERAESNNFDGYKVIYIDKVRLGAHVATWMWWNGNVPEKHLVDHKDRNPSNNRIENLRLATESQNKINSVRNRKTKSGYRGVYKNTNGSTKPWSAKIAYEGKVKFIGCFACKHDAAEAYNSTALELHADFAFLNVIDRSLSDK